MLRLAADDDGDAFAEETGERRCFESVNRVGFVIVVVVDDEGAETGEDATARRITGERNMVSANGTLLVDVASSCLLEYGIGVII